MSKRALGRGLGALIGETVAPTGASSGPAARRDLETMRGMLGDREAVMLPVEDLAPNPHQPRNAIDDNSLQELAMSIRSNGVLQPILVRRREMGFEIVAGERRARAARLAGLHEIPALVCTLEEAESMKVALLENIQRENLNALEEAHGYRAVMEAYGATHQELADLLGKNRSTVSNMLRLLGLESSIQELVRDGVLSMGHARALLAIDDPRSRLRVARQAAKEGLSVRAVEELAQGRKTRAAANSDPSRRRAASDGADAMAVRELESRLRNHLGSPCKIVRRGRRGRIEIEFFSDEELERVLERVGVSTQL